MDNARKPSKQQLIRRSARIREHAADPTAHGTPAWKVDQLLHDGDLSAMSVLDVIDYETRRLKDADGFVDPSDMAGVCRHLSREKVLHVALGVPVLQVRAPLGTSPCSPASIPPPRHSRSAATSGTAP